MGRLLALLTFSLWVAACLLLPAGDARAQVPLAAQEKAQTIVHMLDYVGVDYPEFVQDGKVVNEDEYREQKEFATQVQTLLAQLPAVPSQPALQAQAADLLARIDAKAAGRDVAARAAELRAGVIAAWNVTVAPRQAPLPERGAALYTEHCAACHGAQGRGDGPLAKGMEPAPSDFHDAARMSQRSLYGLYNTVSLGVGGTPMRAFKELTEADRWALAFHVAGLRADPALLARGEAAWKAAPGQGPIANLRTLVTGAPGEQAALGGDSDALRAYLTRHPDALQAAAPSPLAYTRARLDDALKSYRAGDREGARRLAIAAYLEGFELVEAALDNVDAKLRAETEREMMALRGAIGEGQPADAVAAQVGRLHALLDRAGQQLDAGTLSPGTAFAASLLILLREGLEALLVLAAIIAFVKKTDRRDALPWIHAGWIGAAVLGGVTWLLARHVIDISGANREITEGVTALLAAAMLLYVGWWLHRRSTAGAWNRFIREQVGSALARRTLWAMAGVAFLAVYRELFEVILFYETLWVQAGTESHGAVLWGIVAAAALLLVVGWAILRYSVRLPLGPFFAATSGLLAVLAVVFVGNGVAALQEAGVLDASAVRFVTAPLLGIHPTLQGLGAQAMVLALVVTGYLVGRPRSQPAAA